MDQTLKEFYEKRDSTRKAIRDTETALNDPLRKGHFITKFGQEAGEGEYERWRKQAKGFLYHEHDRHRQIEQQIEDYERTSGSVALFYEVWKVLKEYPNHADLRQRIYMFVRKQFNIWFKEE